MEEKKVVTDSNWWDAKEYNQPIEDKPRLPKFNITLGKGEIARTEKIQFLNNGEPIENQYGKSILFLIKHKEVDMVWFVKSKSYSLINGDKNDKKTGIKQNMPIEGKVAYVTRAGTTQTDTRWAIKFE